MQPKFSIGQLVIWAKGDTRSQIIGIVSEVDYYAGKYWYKIRKPKDDLVLKKDDLFYYDNAWYAEHHFQLYL